MTKTPTPYIEFSREEWGRFRRDTPMILTEADLDELHGQLETVSLSEIAEIYLPLARLLRLYIDAMQELYTVTGKFSGHPEPKVPYVIGVSGSVAVGKSTTSRVLKAILSRWPKPATVEIVTTDGYLYPNSELIRRGLLERKGFPESYDLRQLINFLRDLKSGKSALQVPIYSHHNYDNLPGQFQLVNQPDIVIVEGLNVLQLGANPLSQNPRIFVSDYLDFSIYVDALTETIREWFLQRFEFFRAKAVNDPNAFFYRFATMTDEEALTYAKHVWDHINEKNLTENILPFRLRAQCILTKTAEHVVEKVLLRKL